MKTLFALIDMVRWLGILLLCGHLHAQSSPATTATNNTTEPKEPATEPVRTLTAPSTESTDTTPDLSTFLRDGRIVTTEEVENAIKFQSDPLRPVDRPEYLKITPEVRQKLIQFQKTRERYLLEQQRLIKIYKGATEEERDKIRELIRTKRERWIDQSRRIRQDARERTIEMMRELPKHQEAFEAVKDQRDQIKNRSGQD